MTLLLLGVTLFNHASVRPDSGHIYSTMIVTLIIFSFFSSKLLEEGTIFKKQRLKKPLWTVLKVLLLFFVVSSFIAFLTEPIWNENIGWISLNMPRSQGITVPSDQQDFIDSINYIKQNVPPNEKIFVANSRNDQLLVNNVMFYFLSERDSATRYHDMHPGVTTTQPVQMEIISELEKNKVQYIVLWNATLSNEPNKSSISSGVFILDNYIKNNYSPVKIFGNYTIYRKTVFS